MNHNPVTGKFEKTHGQYGTKLYWVWDSMLNRVNNPRHKYYANYGGRGITVCEEWQKSFASFYSWAVSNGYAEGLTLDRFDNNSGYNPCNCRWITHKQQQNNKRNNHFLTLNGDTHTIAEWGEITGIPHGSIRARLRNGWSVEKTLTTPLMWSRV